MRFTGGAGLNLGLIGAGVGLMWAAYELYDLYQRIIEPGIWG